MGRHKKTETPAADDPGSHAAKGCRKPKAAEAPPTIPPVNKTVVTNIDTVDVKWNQTLTWALITAIGKDADICRGLFPGPGANASTSKGGGKKKTKFQFSLAEVLFDEHEEYGEDFARVATAPPKTRSALRKAWIGKIKNKISTYI